MWQFFKSHMGFSSDGVKRSTAESERVPLLICCVWLAYERDYSVVAIKACVRAVWR